VTGAPVLRICCRALGLALRDVASLQNRAASAGLALGIHVQRLLDVPWPWTSRRTVYRLLGLTRSYCPAAVDAACARDLELDAVDVRKIARILEQTTENNAHRPV
jgi:hypothetical protein